MYFEKDEILHLINGKKYKVVNFIKYNNEYYYLLENMVNHKYIVVNAYLIDSELYLKEVKDEDVLLKLDF